MAKTEWSQEKSAVPVGWQHRWKNSWGYAHQLHQHYIRGGKQLGINFRTKNDVIIMMEMAFVEWNTEVRNSRIKK